MTTDAKRSIDGGGPFFLPAPPSDPSAAACGHGVWVETPFDTAVEPGRDAIALMLRRAERLAGASARVHGQPVAVSLLLSSVRCVPLDDTARRFLEERPWLRDALTERREWFRERAHQVAAQRDRDSVFRAALERAEPGDMIPYDALFPADWDLLVVHEGSTYWAIDHHCPNHACTCAEIFVELHQIDSADAERVGDARIDLDRPKSRPKASTPLAAEVTSRLLAKHRDDLVRRRAEVRRAVARHAAEGSVAPQEVDSPPGAIARNAPCPCGSGKKHKRCCANRVGSSAEVLAARTRSHGALRSGVWKKG